MMSRHKPVLLALTISLVCGIGGNALGMPLPWMLGPMIGNTLAALIGAPIKGPNNLRPLVVPVIGVMLGSAVTPALFTQMGAWAATLIILPLSLAGAAAISYFVYRRIGKYDPVTAYYASMPGGLNEMILLGDDAGGDGKKIALAHASRVLLVIFFVVAVFWVAFGVRSSGTSNWTGLRDLSLSEYTVLAVCAVAGLWIGRRVGLPAAPVFGPMALSGAAHLAGWVTLPPPNVFVIAAQMVMGTVIGARFIGTTWQELGKDLRLGVLSCVLMLCAAAMPSALLVLTGFEASQAFLAFAPGGLTEMSLLALAMDQDPAYVSTVHLLRISLVVACAPLFFRVIGRFSGR